MTQPPNGSMPPPGFQPVTPVPTPFSLASGVLDGTLNGLPAKLVLLRWGTPVGEIVLFCAPVEAENFANQMLAAARQAKSGLILP